MQNVLLSFLCCLVHIPSLLMRLLPFRQQLTARRKRGLCRSYGAGLALDFLLCLYVCRTGGITIGFYKLNLVLFAAVMGAVNILVIPGLWREHMFTFGVTALIVTISLATAACLTDRIGYATVQQGLILESLMGIGIFAALYPWTRRLIHRTVTPFLALKSEAYWKTIWFVPISMFFSCILTHGIQEYSDSLLDLLRLLLVGAATYLICRGVAESFQTLLEKRRLDEQVRLQKRYYAALTQTVEKERQARHNFKHHLAAIRTFLNTGDTSALREYCDGLELDLADVAQLPYTGNPAADGVLYHYACQARQQGIAYTVCCAFGALPIGDTDLCCLLGNALDNALEGAVGASGEREIQVAAEKHEGMLVLTVDNSFDGTLLRENGKLLSRKRDHSPGIGIATMEAICQKYGGTCRFEAKGTRFEASFLLRTEREPRQEARLR